MFAKTKAIRKNKAP